MKGSLKDKLAKFLMYFQRYLMTKTTIPMHIEFTLLDTFDMLESCGREIALESYLKTKSRNERDAKMKTSNKKNNKKGDERKDTATNADGDEDAILSSLVFPRYDSMSEVEAAIGQYEAAQSLLVAVDSDGEESDEDDDRGEGTGRPGKAGRIGEQDEPALDGDEEDEGSDNSRSDDDEEGSEESDDEEEDDESISDQHAAKILRENQQRAQEEDIDFERMFKTLVQHSVESVKALSNVKATMDINRMAIPGLYHKLSNSNVIAIH